VRILIPGLIFFFVSALLYFLVPGVKEQPWTASRIAGLVIAVIGYAFVMIARIQLGRSFSFRLEAKGLVTGGPYSRIRNPIYIFLDVTVFGLILALRLDWLFLLRAVLAFFQARQARKEATLLQEKNISEDVSVIYTDEHATYMWGLL
jgi:protein-S-isoprenylcysteine O-methyltransferase Ste14